ncbi:MAG TPA: hypothetical protein VIB48_19865 [Acidimicrobiia bacterium]|jgi:hypothetical protein
MQRETRNADARFATEVTLTGPFRTPAQMLADQRYDDHLSVHDASAAGGLGLAGAPIEGPTHFSQFDPLAALVWDRDWFEHGCISSHFQTMVVEGEEVRASMTLERATSGRIEVAKPDGAVVLRGTASVGDDDGATELDARQRAQRPPGELFIIDRLEIGMRRDAVASVDHTSSNGPLYPFSLADKLARITEPHPWYTEEGGASSPWGRAILPMEMISVLAYKSPPAWPVRTPALGLFLDLEVRLVDGPLSVGHEYRLRHEIVGLGESRRTESYWTRTTIEDPDHGTVAAHVVLHSGVFKESYPGYPTDRLA